MRRARRPLDRSASTASACSWLRSPRCCSRSACSRRPNIEQAEVVHGLDAAARGGADRRVPRARPRSLFFVFFEFVLVPMYFLIAGWGHGNRRYAATKFFLYTMAGSAFLFVGILSRRVPAPARDRASLTFDVRDAHRRGRRRRRAVDRRRPSGCSSRSRRLRGEGAAVPVPHVAARRAHRRADRGLGRAGRRAAEDGHLRVPALRDPDVPAGRGRPRADPARARGDRHHLRRDRRRDATEPETDHRVLVGRAPRLRRARHLRAHAARASRAACSRCCRTGSPPARCSSSSACSTTAGTPTSSRDFRGLWKAVPVFGGLFVAATFASIGLPGFSGFVGEFLALLGAFLTSRWYAVVATTGVILAAVYLLWAVQRAFTGEPDERERGDARHRLPRDRARSCRCSACRCSSASTRSRCSTASQPSVERARAPRRATTATTRRRRSATRRSGRRRRRERQVIRALDRRRPRRRHDRDAVDRLVRDRAGDRAVRGRARDRARCAR